MVDLWVLHIDSLRRTFDQTLMKIFQRVQEKVLRKDRWTDRRMDGRTDEGHFYNPPSASRRGIKMQNGLCPDYSSQLDPNLVSYIELHIMLEMLNIYKPLPQDHNSIIIHFSHQLLDNGTIYQLLHVTHLRLKHLSNP